jgi:hypothetical protein
MNRKVLIIGGQILGAGRRLKYFREDWCKDGGQVNKKNDLLVLNNIVCWFLRLSLIFSRKAKKQSSFWVKNRVFENLYTVLVLSLYLL